MHTFEYPAETENAHHYEQTRVQRESYVPADIGLILSFVVLNKKPAECRHSKCKAVRVGGWISKLHVLAVFYVYFGVNEERSGFSQNRFYSL